MKKELQLLLGALLIMVSSYAFAQTVTYDLRCSSDNSRYELFITRNTTATVPFTTAGSSRVTLVLPTGSTRTVAHTSEANTSFIPMPAIINPNGTDNDYYGFTGAVGASYIGTLIADTPTLWMTFTPSDGVNQDARLFINGTDPIFTDPGMNGADLYNTFFVLTASSGSVDEYNGNISNTINCNGTLTTSDITLSRLTLYPNPTESKFRIEGLLEPVTLSVYDLKGRLVLEENDYLNRDIDISKLVSAMYLIKIENTNGVSTKRLIKK